MIRQCHLSGKSWQESYDRAAIRPPLPISGVPCFSIHDNVQATCHACHFTVRDERPWVALKISLWHPMFHCAPTLLAYSPAPLGGLRTALSLFHIQAHTNTKGRHIARHYHKHTSLGLTVSILLCLSYTILNINLTATLPTQQWKRKRSSNMANIHKIGWEIKWVK